MINARIGFGTDFHCLIPGNGFRLGGIWIAGDYACKADSDGDVVLHALTDALLGALALGDIGDFYPEVEPGESSERFVRETVQRLRERKATVINVDCVIDLERPKIAEWKHPMRANIAELLDIPPTCVSVKAKTREGQDAVGQSKGVAAQVVVLVEIAPHG